MSHIKNIQPVFLISSVRSGSTLLRLMLNSHPNIVNPGECDFLFDEVSDDGMPPDVDRYVEWLKLNRIFLAKKLEVDSSMGYMELIDSFVSQMQQPDSILTMNVHRHFYRIPKMFPRAKYIHLIRDGRDASRSCVHMGWAGSVYYGIDIWLKAETAWDRLKATLNPSEYMEIKYEDLLENVELGLGRICLFLGLEYSTSMMDYVTKSTYDLPDKRLTYQWKLKFSEREMSLVESKAGEMLMNRGYELSGVPIREPTWLESISLPCKNKWLCSKHKVAVYGYSLFFQSFLARRLGFASWEKSLTLRKNAIDIGMLR